MKTRALILAAALITAIATASCSKPDPRTHVFGDSLTAQVHAAGLTNDSRVWHPQAGAGLDHWEAEIDRTLDWPPFQITLALGSNDAGLWTGGWTASDTDRWRRLIARIPAETRVVVILPWFDPATVGPAQAAEIDEARAVLSTLQHPQLTVVDWKPVAEQVGLAADGIHLGTAAAVQARYDLTVGRRL